MPGVKTTCCCCSTFSKTLQQVVQGQGWDWVAHGSHAFGATVAKKHLSPTMRAPAGPTPLTHEHVVVGIVRDGEEVGWHLCALLAFVHVGHSGPVDGQPLVGVDCHAE